MHQLHAFYESLDPAGALVPIAAVPDDTVTINGDDLYISEDLPFIIGEAALAADASLTRAQIQSPSLRKQSNLDIEPAIAAAVFGSPPETLMHPDSPIPLDPGEAINCYFSSDPSSAVAHYGLVVLSDGPQQKVTGNIYSIRCTASATLVAGQWVSSALVFNQTLPVGDYQIVGCRVRGTNLVAGRFVFVGEGKRPGAPAVNAIGDRDAAAFRFGNLGVWGQFNNRTPPKMEFLGVTDSSQTIILDLVRI